MINLQQMIISYLEANDIETEVVLDSLGAELTLFDVESGAMVAVCKRASLEEALCAIIAYFASTVRDARNDMHHPDLIIRHEQVSL